MPDGRTPDPSRAVEDYLKAVYKLQAEAGAAAVSTTALAEELDRSAASITRMVQGLAAQGLLSYTRYRGARLTALGEVTALRIIRRHRVIELYLIEKLGYSWEDVHAEAERLEHAASDVLIDRMAEALGEPSIDPHGSPIPTRDGELAETAWVPLADLGRWGVGRGARGVGPESGDAAGARGAGALSGHADPLPARTRRRRSAARGGRSFVRGRTRARRRRLRRTRSLTRRTRQSRSAGRTVPASPRTAAVAESVRVVRRTLTSTMWPPASSVASGSAAAG